MPPMIVAPEREVPGISANACATPTFVRVDDGVIPAPSSTRTQTDLQRRPLRPQDHERADDERDRHRHRREQAALMGRAPALRAHPGRRVVAPCGTLVGHEAALQAGLLRLERAGCHVRFDTRAGPGPRRAATWPTTPRGPTSSSRPSPSRAWTWCGSPAAAAGGPRTAAWVLDAAARLAPRHVVGFSDATTFLCALAVRLGWVAHHGPVVTSLGRPEVIEFDLEAGLEALQDVPRAPTREPPRAARPPARGQPDRARQPGRHAAVPGGSGGRLAARGCGRGALPPGPLPDSTARGGPVHRCGGSVARRSGRGARGRAGGDRRACART